MKHLLNKAGVGLATLIVVPFLAIIAVGFILCAGLLLVAGGIRTFGMMEWIQMNVGPVEVPQAFSLPVAFVVAVLLCAIAYLAYKGMRKYRDLVRF